MRKSAKPGIRAVGLVRVVALLLAIVMGLIYIGSVRVRSERDRGLLEAVKKGDVQGAASLLAAGADIETRQPDNGRDGDYWREAERTPLALAVARGNEAMVRMLLTHHANVSAKSVGSDRFPPSDIILTRAAEEGNVEIVRLLLEQGADANARSGMGYTPLMAAASDGNLEIAEFLMAHGADVNARDDRGFTPLFCAQGKHKRDNRPMIRLLIRAGAR